MLFWYVITWETNNLFSIRFRSGISTRALQNTSSNAPKGLGNNRWAFRQLSEDNEAWLQNIMCWRWNVIIIFKQVIRLSRDYQVWAVPGRVALLWISSWSVGIIYTVLLCFQMTITIDKEIMKTLDAGFDMKLKSSSQERGMSVMNTKHWGSVSAFDSGSWCVAVMWMHSSICW